MRNQTCLMFMFNEWSNVRYFIFIFDAWSNVCVVLVFDRVVWGTTLILILDFPSPAREAKFAFFEGRRKKCWRLHYDAKKCWRLHYDAQKRWCLHYDGRRDFFASAVK